MNIKSVATKAQQVPISLMLNTCVAVNTKRSGKWSNCAYLNTKSHYQLYMYDHSITFCSRMIVLQYPIIPPDLERNVDTKREREREKIRVMQVRELPHPLISAQSSVQFCAIIPVPLL
jgi:hypothetical protein